MNVTKITAVNLAKKIVDDIVETTSQEQGSLTLLSAPVHGGKSIVSLLTARQLADEHQRIRSTGKNSELVSLFVGTKEKPPMLLSMAQTITKEPLLLPEYSILRVNCVGDITEYLQAIENQNVIYSSGRTRLVGMRLSAHNATSSEWREPPLLHALVIDSAHWHDCVKARDPIKDFIAGGTHVMITVNRPNGLDTQQKQFDELSTCGLDIVHRYQIIRPESKQYEYIDEEQYYELVFDQ